MGDLSPIVKKKVEDVEQILLYARQFEVERLHILSNIDKYNREHHEDVLKGMRIIIDLIERQRNKI
tara:strand:- start:561 stop:758 length:198 start_codon:yes stop_codon:yes gene_type:complete